MRGVGLIAFALSLAVSDASAQVKDHPVYIGVVSAGAIGGLTNSIAALVYAIDNRSFHEAWIGTTLFSSAVCGAFAGQLMVDAANDRGKPAFVITGIISFLVMSIWPAAWVTYSALADAPLGERFSEEPAVEEAPE
jgi:hypothetical protein